MAGEDDDIVVTIEGETPDPDAGGAVVKVVDESTKKTAGAADDDIVSSLKSQLAEKQTALDSATQRASSAESLVGQAHQRARQLEQEVNDANTRAAESTKSTIETGIAAAKSESQAAQEALTAAFDAGNAKGVAEANRRIARAESELALLENAKVDVPEKPQRQQTTQTDPTEAFINSRTAPTQAWLRAHRDYLTDPKKNAKMQAAHYDAESEGLALDSPQYFEHVEKFLGIRKSEVTEKKQNADAQPSQRRPTAPTAPGAATGGGMSGGAREVTLTAGEAKAATDGTHVWNYDDPTGKGRFKKGDSIGLQEMARRKMEMTKQGRYHNANVDGT